MLNTKIGIQTYPPQNFRQRLAYKKWLSRNKDGIKIIFSCRDSDMAHNVSGFEVPQILRCKNVIKRSLLLKLVFLFAVNSTHSLILLLF